MIWQCPVCGSTRSTNPGVCPICGYDESADREKHPTLICTPGGGTSLSAKIQERKAQKEQKEQKELYKIYLGEIRTQFNATLDNVSVEEKDGTVRPFKEAYKKPYDKN